MSDEFEKVRKVLREAEDVDMDGVPLGEEPEDNGPPPDFADYVPDDNGSGDGAGGAVDSDEESLLPQGALCSLNDSGNGKRFALYCGKHALQVPRVGWHIWDEMRYRLDPDGIAVRRHAQGIQDQIVREIPYLQLRAAEKRMVTRIEWINAALRSGDFGSANDEEMTPEEMRAKLTSERDQLNAALWGRGSTKAAHMSFARSSGNKGRIDAMLSEAVTDLYREVEDLDADPLTVNTESGILRFTVHDMRDDGGGKVASVALEPHAREVPIGGSDATQVITKLMPTVYDPTATCPRFDAFMARVQPDPEMRAFLQRWWGLSITALPVQKFVFQYGKGANGKSVLSDLMNRLLGDYATTVKIKSLTGRNNKSGADATPDLMPLVGARAALASEPEEGDRLQEGMIKEMTGGEPILVRQLHADFIEVRPYFKLTISGNHKPDIRGTDDGIWRRVLLVPFDVQIPEKERDENLVDKLWQERPGILNWLVAGLTAYLEGGLQEPAQVLNATQEYRADSDPIGTFLNECCVVSGGPDDFLSARDLIDGFNLWLDQRGEGMWGQRTVSLKMKGEAGRYRDPTTNRAFEKGKRDVTGYRGIRFTDIFKRSYDNAPRNNQGRPMAYVASGGSSRGTDTGDGGEDF